MRLSSTAGVHPHDAKHYHADEIAKLAERVPIVGECGIDFDRMFSPAEVQKEAFISQLLLAKRLGKPVFLHQRLGFAEFNAIMDKHWPKGESGVFGSLFFLTQLRKNWLIALWCIVSLATQPN